mgnify:CR=1 FL=1
MSWPFPAFAALLIALAVERLAGYPDFLQRRIGHPVEWLAGINPRRLWGLVVLMMALQGAGHVALRIAGARDHQPRRQSADQRDEAEHGDNPACA